MQGAVAEFLVPDWGDIVDCEIRMSYRPASLCSLAVPYDDPRPEWTLSPRSGTKNLATGDIHSYRGSWWYSLYLYTELVTFPSYTNLVVFLVACFISILPQNRDLIKIPGTWKWRCSLNIQVQMVIFLHIPWYLELVTDPVTQGITKRCPLSWLTNSALPYEPKCGGRGSCGVSANEYSCTQEPK